jgi:hypothetical protein
MDESDLVIQIMRIFLFAVWFFFGIAMISIATDHVFKIHDASFQTTFFQVVEQVAPNGQLDRQGFDDASLDAQFPASEYFGFCLMLEDEQGTPVGDKACYNRKFYASRRELGIIARQYYALYEGRVPIEYDAGKQGDLHYSFVFFKQ